MEENFREDFGSAVAVVPGQMLWLEGVLNDNWPVLDPDLAGYSHLTCQE